MRLGLSQDEFAELLGCRQQTVSEWETGIYLPGNAYGRLLKSLETRAPFSLSASQPSVTESFGKLDDSLLGEKSQNQNRSDFDWTID